MTRLAEETIEAVVLATGATGGGYILIDPLSAKVAPVAWVGLPSQSWPEAGDSPQTPSDWPPLTQLQPEDGIWLSQSDGRRTRARLAAPKPSCRCASTIGWRASSIWNGRRCPAAINMTSASSSRYLASAASRLPTSGFARNYFTGAASGHSDTVSTPWTN